MQSWLSRILEKKSQASRRLPWSTDNSSYEHSIYSNLAARNLHFLHIFQNKVRYFYLWHALNRIGVTSKRSLTLAQCSLGHLVPLSRPLTWRASGLP